ncbi:MAG: ECF transporter S component [Bacillota bacterium]
MMNNTKSFSIKDIVMIGMMAAILIIATTIKIPYGNGAMVHLGTAALFTIAIVFGGKYAGLSGAIGTALFDMVMGFSPYTLWSFFIKGIAGFIVGIIAHSGEAKGNKIVRNVLACFAGAAWTLFGYIVAWTVVIGKLEAAVLNIPSSLITSGVGFVIAIPLSAALRAALSKTELLK